MNKERKTSVLLLGILMIVLVGFGALILGIMTPTMGSTGNIKNDVTNNITNNVVTYDDLTITDVDKAIQVAVKKVESAVIGVTSNAVIKSGSGIFSKETEAGYSTGSGVIYKQVPVYDGDKLVNYIYYVVTNRHVVTLAEEDKAKYTGIKVYAYLGDEDIEIEAKVVGFDAKVDIALITFESPKYIEPVKFADSDKLEKGQLAIAVGNPGGYEYYGSVTFGVISSPERYISTDTDNDNTDDFYAEYIQHDVAINPGNSGGGLFNINGELIGINTLKLVDNTIDNMGFAIPSNVARNILVEYIEKGKLIQRPKLGVLGTEIRSLTSAIIENSEDIIDIPNIYNGEKSYGIYVVEVYDGTTIAQTEIDKHDIILEINGIKLTRMYIVNSKLNSLIEGFQVGETVTIKYYDRSSNSIKSVDVILKP